MTDQQDASKAQDVSGAVDRQRVTKVGVVTSNKMSKTVVVNVERFAAHKIYGRTQRHSKKFMAHDAEEKCSIGDRVMIAEAPPLSKHKRWRVTKIIEKAQ